MPSAMSKSLICFQQCRNYFEFVFNNVEISENCFSNVKIVEYFFSKDNQQRLNLDILSTITVWYANLAMQSLNMPSTISNLLYMLSILSISLNLVSAKSKSLDMLSATFKSLYVLNNVKIVWVAPLAMSKSF